MATVNRIIHKTSRQGINSLRVICSQKLLSRCTSLWHKSPTYVETHPYTSRRFVSESNGKVLNQSTLIVQDGIDIEELPILIKRTTRDSFPFTSHSYSGEKIRQESEFDTSFRQVLQNCYSVNEVFKLLEVPSDKVRGYSAAFALQRLHVLKYLNTDWNQIHSFIRSAVMRELYDTVQRDVGLLSNSTLISLVECYLAAEGFSLSCINAINVEIQSRLGDSGFTIEELLTLASILKSSCDQSLKSPPFENRSPTMNVLTEDASKDFQQPPNPEHFDRYSARTSLEIREEIRTKCQELLTNVWVNLTSRYTDINEHTLPHVLQVLPKDNKYLVSLLEKPMNKFWTDLSAEGVGICLHNLVRLRVYSSSFMKYLGRWAYVNIHQMTPPLLLSFLNTFIQLGFQDDNLIKVMERCLHLKGNLVQTDVVAMCVEYCRSCRYLSPLIMDAAASHFTQHGYSYEPLQLYAVLRAYGQLHYMPAHSSAFLKQVEKCLWDRFDDMKEAHLLEVLGSFTFVDILPKNFYNRVTSQYFFNKVGELKNPDKSSALMWLKVLKHAMALDVCTDIDKNFRWVLSRKSKWSVYLYLDSQRMAILSLKFALSQLLGNNYYHVVPFYGCCAVYLDSDGVPLKIAAGENGIMEPQGVVAEKLVILLRSVDNFTANTRQLMGAQAQRMKHLQTFGFIPIEIRANKLMYEDQRSQDAAVEFLKHHLSPHVNFEAALKLFKSDPLDMKTQDEEEMTRDWLGYEDECGFSSDDENEFASLSSSNKSKKDQSISVEDSGLLKNETSDDDKKDPD